MINYQPNVYSAKYEMCDDTIIFIEGDRNYNYLMHLNDEDFYCPLFELPTLSYLYNNLLNFFNDRDNVYNVLSYINHSYWACEITVNNNRLISNATRIAGQPGRRNNNSSYVPISNYINESSIYITTEYDGIKHRIISFLTTYENTVLNIGDDITNLFSFYGSNLKSSLFYDDCIRDNKQITFFEAFHLHGSLKHCMCSIIPISSDPCSRVLTIISMMPKKKILPVQKNNKYLIDGFLDSRHATAWYDIPTASLINYNNAFERIVISAGKPVLDMLFHCNALSSAVNNTNFCIERLAIPKSNGDSTEYECYFIPIIGKSGLLIALYETRMVSNILDHLRQIVTKREFQILLLTLKGLRAEQIAADLNISIGTVNKLLYKSYEKMGVSSKSELFAQIFCQLINGGE